jgi:hypothetical protein
MYTDGVYVHEWCAREWRTPVVCSVMYVCENTSFTPGWFIPRRRVVWCIWSDGLESVIVNAMYSAPEVRRRSS